MMFPKGHLLVFAKAPVPGEVKTRMIPALGAEGAADLHAKLCRHTLKRAVAADLAPIELWCSPDTGQSFFSKCADDYGVQLHAQCGGDLGGRMAEALGHALTSSAYAVLIGTDCPELCIEDLAQAFEALDRGDDAVLGPAQDGGYVLIGLRRPAPALFAGVDWGTERVLPQTRERLVQLKWRWHELAPRRDVDRPEDLQWLSELPID